MSGESRNLLLAIVFSMVILFGFQMLFPPAQEPVQEQTQATRETGSNLPSPQAGISAPGGPVSVPGAEMREQTLVGTKRVTIDTPRLRGSIALTGAVIDDLVLLDYLETLEEGADNIHLLNPTRMRDAYFADFGWVARQQGVKLPDTESVWSADQTTLTPIAPVTLSWDNGEGLVFQRVIAIDSDYMFSIEQRVINTTGEDVELFPYGLLSRRTTPAIVDFYIMHEGPLGVIDDTLTEIDYDDMQEDGEIKYTTTGGWIGITDKYWLTALAPAPGESATMRFLHQIDGGEDKYQTDYLGTKKRVAAGSSLAYTTHLFAGAKEVNLLDRYAQDFNISQFDLAIDFGWFYFLTKPFFYALQWLNGIFGNYGVAILLFTVGVKLVLLPLANKSYKAMSRMKQLQPEMLRIRDQFKEDRMRQQQEMMALYKREKVNPASGCLPIIVQIPVFFALYKVLFVSIEMRHAPFYGWIHDLSAPDPTTIFNLFGLIPWDPPSFLMIGVWPLIMGGTMFLQQKLNPAPTDPMQQKIMAFLPLVFTILLATFPAGLVIYWAWNNLLSIAQQKYIMWRMGVP